MTELENTIQNYFGISKTDELNNIGSLFKSTQLKKGDYLLKTGQQCDKMSFVQNGLIRMFVDCDGKEITQWISQKGYFTADISSFIFGGTSRWNIQALTDAEVFSISKVDYNKINDIVPRWAEFEKAFIIKCFTILEDRVFSHLSMTAEERYHFFFSQNKELFNQVPLQYIASMLGMTPETFSRIRKKEIS